mmetsp:Transcript_40729/g.29983  ORF Transcript_40729/g.29983 Transcript_40729/m.29983 type:complete len:191 (+) Transcript_40729:227-799(+)
MLCSSSLQVGLFGSLYFSGVVVGFLFTSHLGDEYGRIFCIRLINIVRVIMFSVLLFAPLTLKGLYVFMFFFGMAFCLRVSNSYLYLHEVTTPQVSQVTTPILNLMSMCPQIIVPLVFWHLSKDWRTWVLAIYLLIISSLVISMLMPESPLFLISKMRFREAKESYNFMAKLNCRKKLNLETDLLEEEVKL